MRVLAFRFSGLASDGGCSALDKSSTMFATRAMSCFAFRVLPLAALHLVLSLSLVLGFGLSNTMHLLVCALDWHLSCCQGAGKESRRGGAKESRQGDGNTLSMHLTATSSFVFLFLPRFTLACIPAYQRRACAAARARARGEGKGYTGTACRVPYALCRMQYS